MKLRYSIYEYIYPLEPNTDMPIQNNTRHYNTYIELSLTYISSGLVLLLCRCALKMWCHSDRSTATLQTVKEGCKRARCRTILSPGLFHLAFQFQRICPFRLSILPKCFCEHVFDFGFHGLNGSSWSFACAIQRFQAMSTADFH